MRLLTYLAIVIAAQPVLTSPAFAHGGTELTDASAWSAWLLTPDIVLATAVMAALYIVGMVRRRASRVPVPWWRHLLFFSGLAAVFLALQSSIDPIAERLFLVHQIQHLLLRMIGPMLLALSWPQGILSAGLPSSSHRGILAPVMTNNFVRRLFRFLARPAVATGLFIGTLYVWQIPRYHDFALLNEPVHYAMHATMLLSGILFWWRIFDRRPPASAVQLEEEEGPQRHSRKGRSVSRGLRYGIRLMMLWLVILSNILIGAYTALKTTVLYSAYDLAGRLFGFSALADEEIGGIILWIPSSMMCLVAVLIVIHLWGLHETKMEVWRVSQSGTNSAAQYPVTGMALIHRARPKNRAMAIGFVLFVLMVFMTAIMIGFVRDLSSTIQTDLAGSGSTEQHMAHGGL